MDQDPESTAEVMQVLETTEAAADQAVSADVPLVLPSEPATEAEKEKPEEKPQEKPQEKPKENPEERPKERPKEIPEEKPEEKPKEKPEEKSDKKPEEKPAEGQAPQLVKEEPPAVAVNEVEAQEETGPTTELEPAAEGPDMGNTRQGITFADEESSQKDVSEGLSEEKLKRKSKLERMQRLKESLKNRFNVSFSHANLVKPEETVEVEAEEEGEGEEEEEVREETLIDKPPVIDATILEEIDAEVEAEDDDGDDSDREDEIQAKRPVKFKAGKKREVLPPHFGNANRDDDDFFYRDPKYDFDSDNLSIVSAKSIRSIRSTKSFSQDPVELKSNFLRDFEMPSLSDISEEQEPEPLPQSVQVSPTASLMDRGTFVDPVTGEVISSSSSSSESELAAVFDQEDQEDGFSPQKDSSSELSDIPTAVQTPPQKQHTITFEEFRKSFISLEGRSKSDSEEEFRAQGLELVRMVRDFVEDLLIRLVTSMETRKSDNVLRSRCDKMKLTIELRRVTDQHVFEKYTNELLTARLVDYFKRLKNNRVFEELDPKQETQYYVRYQEALARVDSLKEHVDRTKHLYALQINKVILDLHSAQSVASFTELRLEAKIRHLLVRPDSEFLKRYVDWELRQMSGKRNEISDMRLTLITKKHTQGYLQEKIKELETLSSTVSIQDFISIQNDVINLEKKIEERNVDLVRMRAQYLMDVHLTHHNREKALALEDKLQDMQIALRSTIDRQRTLRGSLYNKKLERTKLRETRKELTFQGGILAMPSLMYEYDNTVQQLKDRRERVAKLRESVKTLTRRLSSLEGRSVEGRSV